MLTLLISLLISSGCTYAAIAADQGQGVASVYGVVSFLVSMLSIGFVVRKKTTKVQEELEAAIEKDQARIQRKIQAFQSKPGADPVRLQRQLDADQKVMLEKSLAFTEKFEPFKKWNFFMGRQIATMRLQFNYQLKKFKEVDAILATRSLFTGPVLMEPMLVAMKMARHYANEDFVAAEKTFKRHVRWFRKDRKTLLYATMSWIHMKNGESEKALALLLKGKDKTNNETLARNCEHLANYKEKKFSNAGLGEEWYALYLEKPPSPKQKRMRGKGRF